jgi:hypothetical protein
VLASRAAGPGLQFGGNGGKGGEGGRGGGGPGGEGGGQGKESAGISQMEAVLMGQAAATQPYVASGEAV